MCLRWVKPGDFGLFVRGRVTGWKVPYMRTASECLCKAADMDLKASQCVMADEAAAYADMAETWRQLAHEAAWHNACSDLRRPLSS
jgi:hypothetical protein